MIAIPCPDCGGFGEVRNWRSSPEADCDVIECPRCHGEGAIRANPATISDESWEALMRTDNDNNSTTPTLDAAFALLTTTATPRERWALEGWLWHLRATRHQNHAASSWAKHREDFGSLTVAARAMAVARVVDFGVTHEDAAELFKARIAARTLKERTDAAKAAQTAA